MNITETTRLCRAIASIAPAQKFDDETPAMWSVVLADIRYEDAREAVVTLAKRQAYMAPADLIGEVRRIRLRRLDAMDRLLPDVDPDDVKAWLAARREAIAALADGRIEAPDPGPDGEPLAIDGVFPRPPRTIPSDYSAKAIASAPATVDPEAARAMEAERDRQLAALAPLVASEADE